MPREFLSLLQSYSKVYLLLTHLHTIFSVQYKNDRHPVQCPSNRFTVFNTVHICLYSHSFLGLFFGLFMPYILFLKPLFHPLFHLSEFLLHKRLQNRLRNGGGWLRGISLLPKSVFNCFYSIKLRRYSLTFIIIEDYKIVAIFCHS